MLSAWLVELEHSLRLGLTPLALLVLRFWTQTGTTLLTFRGLQLADSASRHVLASIIMWAKYYNKYVSLELIYIYMYVCTPALGEHL